MFSRYFFSFLSTLLLFPGALAAQTQTFHVEPAKSEVHFGLGDPLHAVNGTFRVESGSFMFNLKEGAMSGGISVDAGSGSSGNAKRDHRMTEEELKARSFRTVTFSPKYYTGVLAASGHSTITVEGVFTLLGTPHEISVPMQIQRDGTRCVATGTFIVPYVKWGLKDPSVFVLRVGKEVEIHFVLVGWVTGG